MRWLFIVTSVLIAACGGDDVPGNNSATGNNASTSNAMTGNNSTSNNSTSNSTSNSTTNNSTDIDMGQPDSGPGPIVCGDAVCEESEVCVQGTCFAGCVDNADCSDGQLCFGGRCATSACDGIQCVDGEVCAGGACRTSCATDADCGGENCIQGACYDLPNQPPRVNAGLDQTVGEGVDVTINGSAVDPDGTINATVWTQLSGDPVAFTETGATLEFTAPQVATETTYEFQLEAFDDFGASDSDTTVVTVQPTILPPTADAGADFESNHDVEVTLTGSGMDDGMIVTWSWSQIAGPSVTINDADQPLASFDAPVVTTTTTLTFELAVTDDDGESDTDQVVVTLVPLNTPPVVDAGADQTVRSSDSVVLIGTATDANITNGATTASWTQLSGTTVTLTGADTLNPSFTAPDVDCIEKIEFELSVSDASGSTVTDTVEILVLDNLNTITADTAFDLEDATGGGFTATGSWQHGAPTSGPNAAYSGSNVWATVLDGNTPADETSYLTLPPFDLSAETDPNLSFRMWVRADPGSDGLQVEVNNGAGWGTIPGDERPAYQRANRWHDTRGPDYQLYDVDLSDSAGGVACVRLAFVADTFLGAGAGAYVDDFGLHTESSDPDGDNVIGIRSEILTSATDPFIADTDRDGVDDGVELSTDMTNPANPADFAGATVWAPGMSEDLEAGAGGLAAHPGFQWEHGGPANGPQVAHSGGQVWATNLDGNYQSNAVDYLYLPVIDLTNATDPTLTMFIWTAAGLLEPHGPNVQIRVGTGTWTSIDPAILPYNGTTIGQEVWVNQTSGPSDPNSPYLMTALSLQPWVGSEVELRIGFHASAGRVGAGAYIDTLSLYEESDDPDSDGLAGVITELQTHGTDPFDNDTDGDGVDDGTELLTDATPALNPAIYNGSVSLTADFYEDFEGATGGNFMSDRMLWDHGYPSAGPAAPYSGSFVWGTNLTGNAPAGSIEYLYLPEIDLTNATNPTLSLRFWTQPGLVERDGLNVQIWTNGGWELLNFAVTPYNQTPTGGLSVWSNFTQWTFAATSLSSWVGETIQLRIAYIDLGGRSGPGGYVDDVAVTEESSDPDGDTLPGILGEFGAAGTDPFVADTDGDGVDDNLDTAPLDETIQ